MPHARFYLVNRMLLITKMRTTGTQSILGSNTSDGRGDTPNDVTATSGGIKSENPGRIGGGCLVVRPYARNNDIASNQVVYAMLLFEPWTWSAPKPAIAPEPVFSAVAEAAEPAASK